MIGCTPEQIYRLTSAAMMADAAAAADITKGYRHGPRLGDGDGGGEGRGSAVSGDSGIGRASTHTRVVSW